MKLYYSHNLNPRMAVAVARYLGSPVEFIRAAPRDPANEEGFRPINPNTLVPVLVEDNRTIWETDAIVCRLSELAGSNFWLRDQRMTEMIMWISWATHHLTRHGDAHYFYRIVWPTFADTPPDEKMLADQMVNFKKFAKILDDQLKGRKWLVADQLSYADFRVATVLPFAEKARLPIKDYPDIVRWHDQLQELEAWRDPFKGLDG